MTKSSKSSKSKESSTSGGSKELNKKIDELNLIIQNLNQENEELKQKLKQICRKIVDNTDMANYSFLDASSIEQPDQIDLKDLMHMLQSIILLASQLPTDNLETHVEKLELRITELTNDNSTFFKNKLKLQERLEFIMQERDVWKRNAETLKKMYTKLGNNLNFCVFKFTFLASFSFFFMRFKNIGF
jgi:chromosome segregation ATPase